MTGSSAVEVRQLRAFVAVAEHGSVSAAAQVLGLAQSTVSEALSSLDRAVGVSVVRRRRGAHSVTLTPFGEALLPHAMRVLREIDDAHVSLANVTREAQARVRIAANESVSTYLLAPVLGRLRRRWPRTQFSVVVGACAEIRAAVAADSCDVGLLLEARPRPGDVPPGLSPTSGALASSTLVDDVPLTIFGAPDHPLAQRVDVPSASLSAFSLLIADSAGDFHQLVQRYFLDGDLPGPRLESVGSIEAVKRGVTADHASLGLLPRYAVEEELAAGRVRAVAVVQAPPRMRLVALRSRGPDTHPVVRDLLLSLGAAETRARRWRHAVLPPAVQFLQVRHVCGMMGISSRQRR